METTPIWIDVLYDKYKLKKMGFDNPMVTMEISTHTFYLTTGQAHSIGEELSKRVMETRLAYINQKPE